MAEIEINGLRVHYQRIGAGRQRVIFIHGLVVDNLSSLYFTVANPIAKQAEVLLYDLRGHGRSQRPKAGYGLMSFMDDLNQLVKHLEFEQPFYLLGNSFGGLVALCYAAKYQGQVAGVGLIDGLLPQAGWGEKMVASLMVDDQTRDGEIIKLYKDWHAKDSSRKRSRLAENARQLVYHTSLLDDLKSSAGITTDDLGEIICPVLALYGEHSSLLEDINLFLKPYLPKLKIQIIANASHQVLFESTADVRESIVAWLNRQS